MSHTVVVTFNVRPAERAILAEAMAEAATLIYLTDLDEPARIQALHTASAILARDTFIQRKPPRSTPPG